MASLLFAQAKSIAKSMDKYAYNEDLFNYWIETSHPHVIKYSEEYEKLQCEYIRKQKNIILENELNKFDRYLDISARLHERYQLAFEHKTTYWFITIRPNDSNCTFIDFKNKFENFINRSCFISYTYSYEQKGTTENDIGKGFHVHLVADMRQRSKAEVLRDIKSSWNSWIKKGWIAENCIQVIPTKNPNTIIDDYLIEYKSDDNHKACTKEMDIKWRKANGLKNIYNNNNSYESDDEYSQSVVITEIT